MRGSKLATSADQLRCFSNFNCCVVLPGTLFFPGKITGKPEPQKLKISRSWPPTDDFFLQGQDRYQRHHRSQNGRPKCSLPRTWNCQVLKTSGPTSGLVKFVWNTSIPQLERHGLKANEEPSAFRVRFVCILNVPHGNVSLNTKKHDPFPEKVSRMHQFDPQIIVFWTTKRWSCDPQVSYQVSSYNL